MRWRGSLQQAATRSGKTMCPPAAPPPSNGCSAQAPLSWARPTCLSSPVIFRPIMIFTARQITPGRWNAVPVVPPAALRPRLQRALPLPNSALILAAPSARLRISAACSATSLHSTLCQSAGICPVRPARFQTAIFPWQARLPAARKICVSCYRSPPGRTGTMQRAGNSPCRPPAQRARKSFALLSGSKTRSATSTRKA